MKHLTNTKGDPYDIRPSGTVGHPPARPKDIVLFLMIKELFCLSYLDTESFLEWICEERSWLMKTIPDANTAQEHIKDIPFLYLAELLQESISCLGNEGLTVIIDATGISLNQYGQWIRVRNGRKKMKRKFVKIHLAADKESNKILVGLCSKGWKHDHKFGVQLVRALRSTCRRYSISIDVELLDAGYLSRIMTDEIEKSNAKPYIKMKKNSTTKSRRRSSWKRNIRLQKDHPEEFMKVYCYRVVIEGIISAFKRVFGSMIASKKRHHKNMEVLCRLVLWNCIH